MGQHDDIAHPQVRRFAARRHLGKMLNKIKYNFVDHIVGTTLFPMEYEKISELQELNSCIATKTTRAIRFSRT